MDLLLFVLIAEVIVLYTGLAISEYTRRSDLPKLKRSERKPRPRSFVLWEERKRA